MINDNSIYLHFFDRELRNSINRNLSFSDILAQQILSTALFMTRLPLYVSLSNMYESLDNFPTAINTAFALERVGLLRMVTSKRNREEFFVSRRSLYSFDKNRYSHYFFEEETNWPLEPLIIFDDTTTILRTKLFECFNENKKFPVNTRDSLQESLIKNRNDALTFSFFRKTLQDEYQHHHLSDYQYQQSITDIRTAISRQYTERYLIAQDGTIITGIPGLTLYDYLAKDTFLTNYRLFSELLFPLFSLNKYTFFDPMEYRLSDSFQLLYSLLQWIVVGFHHLTNNINSAIAEIRRYHIRTQKICSVDDYIANCIGLYEYVRRNSSELGVPTIMQTKILLAVATPLELDILLKKIKAVSPVSSIISSLSYFSTVIGDSIVYIVKSQMGQGGVGGSILTLEEAIRILAPDYVIMGGIAWGGNIKKQNIGDLIISTQVWDYDIDRVNPDGSKTYRGSIYPASARLVQMFEVVCAASMNSIAKYGMVASGSDLLDNENYVDDLKKEHPELIGGDMESAGMAAACDRKKVDWIMVKGICDWGYDKNSHKKEYQVLAANNSMDTIVLLLKQFSS